MTKKGPPMTRFLVLFLTLTMLSACATLVPGGRPDSQQLLVTQRWDSIYVRTQYAALSLGLQITSTQDTAHIFTAKRPTGQEVTVTIAPSGFGYLVTFKGTPAHDVTDVVRAYQQTTAF
jgi:hypothetical protein